MKCPAWSRTVGLVGLGALALGVPIAAARADDATGIRIGNFILQPVVGYSLAWTKDSLAAPSTDIRHNVMTSLDVRSDWQRHFLEVMIQGNGIASQDQSNLRYVDGQVRVRGRIDIDHATSLFGDASWQLRHDENLDEERPTGTSSPTPFTVWRAEAGLQRTQGRFDWAVGSRYVRYDYASYTANDGTLVDQSSRNYAVLEPFARLGYRLSPGYRVFTEVALDEKSGSGLAGGSQGSHGTKATGGAEFELTSLVKVTASAGYQTQTFDLPGLVDIATLIWSARLEWSVTPLMTITFASNREVQATGYGTASGRVMTSYSARANYELLRNLTLSAEGRLSQADYIGIDRQDQILIGHLGADYLLSKHWLLTLAAEHQQLKSGVAGQDRTLDKVNFGVKYRF